MTFQVRETEITMLSPGTKLEGKVLFEGQVRVHGTLKGEVTGAPESHVILCETALLEGSLDGDFVTIDGFVQGNIHAKSKITVSGSGRVVGNLRAPKVEIAFGAFFEGKCEMDSTTQPKASPPPKS